MRHDPPPATLRTGLWWERTRAPTWVALVLACVGISCNPLAGDVTGPESLWRATWKSPVRNTSGTPASDGHRLYVLTDGITAFDATTGVEVWANPTPGVQTRPKNLSVHNGRVFAAGRSAVALDASSGRVLWSYPLPIPDSASASLGRTAVDESVFYVGADTHQVFALDQATGTLRWASDIGPDWNFRGIVTGITVAGDTVFVSARQYNAVNGHLSTGWIVGLDRATGRRVWSYRNGNGTDWRTVSSEVSIAGPLLLASDHLSGSVFGVERMTGREVWRHTGAPDKFGSLRSPVPVGGTAYHASMDTYVYAMDAATGSVRWKTKNSGSNISLVVCGGYVFSSYVSLAILDRASGVVRSRSKGSEVFRDFAVSGGRAFVVSDDAVYGYRCE